MVNAAPSMRQIGRFACVIAIGIAAIGAAKAQPGTIAQQIACAPDAYSFCADNGAGTSFTTAGMAATTLRLNLACRPVF